MAERQRGSTTLQMAHQDGLENNRLEFTKIKNWEKKRHLDSSTHEQVSRMDGLLLVLVVCVLVVLLISYVHVSCNSRFGPLLVYAIAVQCV